MKKVFTTQIKCQKQVQERCDIKGTPFEKRHLSKIWQGSWIWLGIPETKQQI